MILCVYSPNLTKALLLFDRHRAAFVEHLWPGRCFLKRKVISEAKKKIHSITWNNTPENRKYTTEEHAKPHKSPQTHM